MTHSFFSTCIALLAALLLHRATLNAQNIDSTFTTNGVLPYGDTLSNSALNAGLGRCLVIQPDGKLVVAMDKADPNQSDLFFYTYRYNADGTPDQSFGENGVSKIFAGDQSKGYEAQVLPDGRIVVIGETQYCVNGICGASQFFMMRLHPGGDLDSTFGINGKIITTQLFGTTGTFAIGYNVKALPDGKLIVAGRGPAAKPFVARLTANGFPDGTFGQNGIFTDTTKYYIYADIAVDAQGSVFMLLQSNNFVNAWPDSSNLSTNYLLKLNASGVLDPSFGSNGIARFDIYNYDAPTALAIKPNGDIVVAGNNWLAFLLPDGTLDATAAGGFSSFEIPNDGDTRITKVLALTDDRLMLAGYTIKPNDNYLEKAFLAQVDGSGVLKTDFNQTGRMIFDYGLVAQTGWQGNLCEFHDLDVTPAGDAYATGMRNPIAGHTKRGLLIVKIEDVELESGTSLKNALVGNPTLNIFPNPAHETVLIESGYNAAYTIFSYDGKSRLSGIIAEGTNAIDVSALRSGLYVIRAVGNDGKTAVRKLAIR